MSVWFTSDLHLGHAKVSEIRGFSSTAEHDAHVVDRWAELVRPQDQVWVLGDLAVSSPDYALEVIDGLPGEKHLIWGNHDQGHPMHRDAHRRAHKYLAVFKSAQAFARRKVGGQSVMVSHFPYKGDTDGRTSDRHVEYRLRTMMAPIIHGHTHSSRRLTVAHRRVGIGGIMPVKQVHVGLDAWNLGPVHIGQVERLLAPQEAAA